MRFRTSTAKRLHGDLPPRRVGILGDRDGLQISYGNQALILEAWGRLDEALALLEKREIMCKGLGNRDSLARCHWSTALVLRDIANKDPSHAPDLLAEARHRAEQALATFSELKMPPEIKAIRNLLEQLPGASIAA